MRRNLIFILLFISLAQVGLAQTNPPADSDDPQDLLHLANMGDVQAMGKLGYIYFHAINVFRDGYEALKWFNLAADKGNSEAQVYSGYMYLQGDCTSKNYFKAMKRFRAAARSGHPYAFFHLGQMHERGEGTPKNIMEAAGYYHLAMRFAFSEGERKQYEQARDRLAPQLTAQEISDCLVWATSIENSILAARGYSFFPESNPNTQGQR